MAMVGLSKSGHVSLIIAGVVVRLVLLSLILRAAMKQGAPHNPVRRFEDFHWCAAQRFGRLKNDQVLRWLPFFEPGEPFELALVFAFVGVALSSPFGFAVLFSPAALNSRFED